MENNNGTARNDHADGAVVIRPNAEIMSRQKLPYYVGISEATAGGAAEPHMHKGYETAIYVLRGRADTCYGEKLENSVVCKEGDFIYIDADVPHQPVNLSATESVVALVARNDANEQEHVVTFTAKERSSHQ